MKLGVISLGCDKATVDSERLVGDLVGHGAVVTADLLHAADAGESPRGAAGAPGARGPAARGAGGEGDQARGAGPGALRPGWGAGRSHPARSARGAARRNRRPLVPPAVRLLRGSD